MILDQAASTDGPSALALTGLVVLNLLGWGLFTTGVWLIFRRISRWQSQPELSDLDRRRMAVSLSVKLVLLVVMLFAGLAVMFESAPVIRSPPASLFCGSEVLIGLAILFWVWRDFGQRPRG